MQRRTRAPPSPETEVELDLDRDGMEERGEVASGDGGEGGNGFQSAPPPSVPPSGGGHGQQSFLTSIFSHLAEAREELESLAARKNTSDAGVGVSVSVGGGGSDGQGIGAEVSVASGSGREEQAVKVRLERCLALVRGVIRGAPGVMSPAHSNRGMGLPWEVNLFVRTNPSRYLGGGGGVSASIGSTAASAVSSTVPSHAPPPPLTGPAAAPSSSSSSSASSWNSGPAEKFMLEVHPLETVGGLRSRVAATNGFGHAPEQTKLFCNGRLLQTDTSTVLEAGVGDGANMWMIVNPNAATGSLGGGGGVGGGGGLALEKATLEEAAKRRRQGGGSGGGGPVHDGDVIARQTGPFDELFRLLQCAHGLEVGGVMSPWECVRAVTTANGEGGGGGGVYATEVPVDPRVFTLSISIMSFVFACHYCCRRLEFV